MVPCLKFEQVFGINFLPFLNKFFVFCINDMGSSKAVLCIFLGTIDVLLKTFVDVFPDVCTVHVYVCCH